MRYKILFFGSSGVNYDRILEFVKGRKGNIIGYLDNNKDLWGKKKNGHLIMPLGEYCHMDKNKCKIVVVSGQYNAIKKQLLSYGCKENIHFFKERYFC